jgi:hypothetical protein
MFESIFLSIAITLVFLFLLLAIMVTAINEIIFSVIRSRAKQLEYFLDNLFFNDPQWVKVINGIKNSPFISVLKKKPKKFPGSIPPENFSTAMLAYLGKDNLTIEAVKAGVEEHKDENSEFYKLMKALLSQNPDLKTLSLEINKIFNNAMDRLIGWYKRYAKIFSYIVALILCAGMNIDSITITRNLYNNKEKADRLASFATVASKFMEKNDSSQVVFTSGIDTMAVISAKPSPPSLARIDSAISKIDTVGKKSQQQLVRSYNLLTTMDLPIGWSKENMPAKTPNKCKNVGLWFLKILGLLVTAAAVSLGAPFWFDLLNKVAPLRKK